MAATYAIVTQALTATGGGTTDLTVSGFGTPAAAILIFSGANTTNNPQSGGAIGVGFWDGTNQRVASVALGDNNTTSSTYRTGRDDYIVAQSGVFGAAAWSHGYQASAVTDGLRLTMAVDNTGVSRYCTAILLKGVSAKVVTLSPHITVGSTYTSPSLGFEPKLVLATTVGHSTNTPSSGSAAQTQALFSFGAAAADGTHRAVQWISADFSADASVSAALHDDILVGQLGSWACDVTTWGSDTFTITTRNAGSGADIAYALAIGGADLVAALGTITTATSTGDVDTSTTGLDPDVLLLAMTSVDTINTTKTDSQANSLSFGATDGTTEAGYALVDEDAAAVMNNEASYSSTKTLHMRDSSGGTASTLLEADATLGAEKFTLTYTTVSGTARKGWYLALGQTAGGSSLPTLTTLTASNITTSGWRATLTAA